MVEKANLVRAYIKELKGVDVNIIIQSQHDLMLLETAYGFAYRHFHGKDYTVIFKSQIPFS